MKTLFGIVGMLLLACAAMAEYPAYPEIADGIRCGDKWDAGHLQGFDADAEHIYWVFTSRLVKTDLKGNVVKDIAIKKEKNAPKLHGGDPCVVDGIVYVAFCGGAFNQVPEDPVNVPLYIQLYDSELNYIKSYHVPEVQYGVGGMTYANGHFYIIGGRPWEMPGNRVQKFDKEFRYLQSYELPMNTVMGIQTISFDGTYFYFGCYSFPNTLYRTDASFQNLQYFDTNAGAYGMIPLKNGKMLCATSRYVYENEKRLSISTAKIIDPEKHLKKVNIITLDAKGKMTFNSEEIDPSKLHARLKEEKNKSFVIRCTPDVSLTDAVAVRGLVTSTASKDVELEILR